MFLPSCQSVERLNAAFTHPPTYHMHILVVKHLTQLLHIHTSVGIATQRFVVLKPLSGRRAAAHFAVRNASAFACIVATCASHMALLHASLPFILLMLCSKSNVAILFAPTTTSWWHFLHVVMPVCRRYNEILQFGVMELACALQLSECVKQRTTVALGGRAGRQADRQVVRHVAFVVCARNCYAMLCYAILRVCFS